MLIKKGSAYKSSAYLKICLVFRREDKNFVGLEKSVTEMATGCLIMMKSGYVFLVSYDNMGLWISDIQFEYRYGIQTFLVKW